MLIKRANGHLVQASVCQPTKMAFSRIKRAPDGTVEAALEWNTEDMFWAGGWRAVEKACKEARTTKGNTWKYNNYTQPGKKQKTHNEAPSRGRNDRAKKFIHRGASFTRPSNRLRLVQRAEGLYNS